MKYSEMSDEDRSAILSAVDLICEINNGEWFLSIFGEWNRIIVSVYDPHLPDFHEVLRYSSGASRPKDFLDEVKMFCERVKNKRKEF